MTVKRFFQLTGNTKLKTIIIFGILSALSVLFLPSPMNFPEQNSGLSDVESNMLTFVTMLEIYAVDWGGVYPSNIDELYLEARKNKYFKKLSVNYESEELDKKIAFDSDLFSFEKSRFRDDKNLLKISFFKYPFITKKASKYQGKIIYAPHRYKNIVTEYRIYGTNKRGDLIRHNSKIYFLSNS